MARTLDRRFGVAWLSFTFALALHVLDEATHDFLSVYNPNAMMIRSHFGIPIPVFTFKVWIASLAAAILLLLCLTPVAFRGARWLRSLAVPISVLAGIFNALLHMASSLYYGRFMPGVYSSPILLAAALFLLISARTHRPLSKATAV